MIFAPVSTLEIVPRFTPIGISQPIHSLARFTHPFADTPFTPSYSLNATTPPAIIDAVCLSELIILSNSTPIHGESRPAFLPDHVPHSRRSDPVSLYTTHATLATRHALL